MQDSPESGAANLATSICSRRSCKAALQTHFPLFADLLDKGPLKHPPDSNTAQFPTQHEVSCFPFTTRTPWDILRHAESEFLSNVSAFAQKGPVGYNRAKVRADEQEDA